MPKPQGTRVSTSVSSPWTPTFRGLADPGLAIITWPWYEEEWLCPAAVCLTPTPRRLSALPHLVYPLLCLLLWDPVGQASPLASFHAEQQDPI